MDQLGRVQRQAGCSSAKLATTVSVTRRGCERAGARSSPDGRRGSMCARRTAKCSLTILTLFKRVVVSHAGTCEGSSWRLPGLLMVDGSQRQQIERFNSGTRPLSLYRMVPCPRCNTVEKVTIGTDSVGRRTADGWPPPHWGRCSPVMCAPPFPLPSFSPGPALPHFETGRLPRSHGVP